MPCDLPCVSHIALYVISLHILHSNSRTSTHWRLNLDEGKVVQASGSASGDDSDSSAGKGEDDAVMDILTGKIMLGGDGEWRVERPPKPKKEPKFEQCLGDIRVEQTQNNICPEKATTTVKGPSKTKRLLNCGKPINTTQHDHLLGVADRYKHPHIPEPEVALIFQKKGSRESEVDMNELEDQLRKAKREKPNSAQVYNQIGNFWRIKGNTQLSIDCFRKALSISPNHPDVLLNMARVLFNLQYLDDAIFLTRRSLEMQSPEQNSWLQHFTLGEILKAYKHYHEASLHFQHALDLNPGFQPAQAHLRDMEGSSSPSVTQYTIFIILFLVLGVLFGVVTSVEANFDDYGEVVKTQRHFNRAMAMRSIKLGINPKLIRMRKYNM